MNGLVENDAQPNTMTTNTPKTSQKSQKSQKRGKKCATCNRKIPFVMRIAARCRCGYSFCTLHKSHNCTYDWTNTRSIMPKITPVQLNKI